MISVGTRFGCKAIDATGSAVILRREGGCKNLELLNGLDGWRGFVKRGAILEPQYAGAVQQDLVAKVLTAIDLGDEDSVGAVAGAGTSGARGEESKRFGGSKRADASEGERQLNYLPGIDDSADVGSVLHDGRSLGGDCYVLGGRTHVERDVYRSRGTHLHAHSGLRYTGEALALHGKVVEADGQGRQSIAALRTDGFVTSARRHISDTDFCARYHGAGIVNYIADESAFVGLGQRGCRPK